MRKHVLRCLANRVGVGLLLVAGMLFWTGCSTKKSQPPGEAKPASSKAEKVAGDAKTGDAKTAAESLNVSLVVPDFCAALVVRPARLLKSPPVAALLELEFIAPQMAEVKEVFFDPATVEEAMLLLTRVGIKDLDRGGAFLETSAAVARFTDPVDAEMVTKKLVDSGLELGKQGFADVKKGMSERRKRQFGSLLGIGDQSANGVSVSQTGNRVTVSLKTPKGLAESMPKAIGEAAVAARQASAARRMMQIGLAIQNHDSARGRFPTQAICDKDGNPTLSWRVAILPYMEMKPLYEVFDHEKAWNSPDSQSNRVCSDTPIWEYLAGQDDWDGRTRVVVIHGEGTAFDGQKHIGTSHSWTRTDDVMIIGEKA